MEGRELPGLRGMKTQVAKLRLAPPRALIVDPEEAKKVSPGFTKAPPKAQREIVLFV